MAAEEFFQLVQSIKQRLSATPVEYGYLEFAKPILKDGLDHLLRASVQRVLAIPAMLFAAGHVKNDIPSVLNNYASQKKLDIKYGRELGIDSQMLAAAGARIQEVLDSSSFVPLSQTLLVVVGRGSSDPDANSNVNKITRMLVEAFGFGWGETVFSGVTFPMVEPGLRHVVKLGFQRIIVFPYFLFSGVLVSRIRNYTNIVANDYPDIEFLSTKYLGNHPFVVDTFVDRINELLVGEVSMNCSLCKYRSNIIGFEKEVGLFQESHHHHVEGLTELCSLCESECTGECQENVTNTIGIDNDHVHDHTHFPYPHSEHPLGPSTLKNQSKHEI